MKNVLAIGPHPDDIELSCFGTLSKLSKQGYNIHILVMTKGEVGGNPKKRVEESKKAAKLIGAKIYFGNFKDTRIPDTVDTIKFIEKHVDKIKPSIAFIPSQKEMHQDHRNTANAAIIAARRVKEVYMYESPSTSKSFLPQVFFDVTNSFKDKIKAVNMHKSQGKKVFMADKAVQGLAQFRGFDIGFNDRLVEAFEVARVVKE